MESFWKAGRWTPAWIAFQILGCRLHAKGLASPFTVARILDRETEVYNWKAWVTWLRWMVFEMMDVDDATGLRSIGGNLVHVTVDRVGIVGDE